MDIYLLCVLQQHRDAGSPLRGSPDNPACLCSSLCWQGRVAWHISAFICFVMRCNTSPAHLNPINVMSPISLYKQPLLIATLAFERCQIHAKPGPRAGAAPFPLTMHQNTSTSTEQTFLTHIYSDIELPHKQTQQRISDLPSRPSSFKDLRMTSANGTGNAHCGEVQL